MVIINNGDTDMQNFDPKAAQIAVETAVALMREDGDLRDAGFYSDPNFPDTYFMSGKGFKVIVDVGMKRATAIAKYEPSSYSHDDCREAWSFSLEA